MAKQRDKSALYHINQCTPKADTIRVHMLQARNALAKKDEEGRSEIDRIERAYNEYTRIVGECASIFEDRIEAAGEDDE